MDRNTLVGFGLIFAIIIGFAYFNQPSDQEVQALKRERDSIALVKQRNDSMEVALASDVQKSEEMKVVDSATMSSAFGGFSSFVNGKEEFSTLENENLKIVLTNKGGRIYSVELKKYKRYDQSPLVLFDGSGNEFAYSFATADAKAISSKDLYFTPQVSSAGKSLSMFVKLAENKYIEQRYTLNDETGLVDYKLNLVGLQQVIAPNTNYIDLNWNSKLLQQEKAHEAEERVATVYYRYADDEPSKISETSEGKEDLKTPVSWICFKQQYFNSTLIAPQNFESAVVESKKDETKTYVKKLSATITLPYNHGENESFDMQFYFGPNHYKTLSKYNVELQKIVTMGWGIFGWVNKYLVVNVFYFLNQFISSFGLIILLLTIIVKTILFPLVYKSYLSGAKMRILKPEIDEIKEKYGNDMTRIQQENMKLYRKAGVNPLGGCVPMLLQLPILFAMFQFFPSAFELRQQSFLWATDLSSYDSILDFSFSIPFYGNHVSLFTILMTVSTLVYTYFNNQLTTVNDQMKWISYIMPVVFLGFFNNYAAGLTYYYFLSNLATIGQQLLIRQFVDDKALHAQMQENKKKPVTKSKFQAKLEEMAKKRGFDVDNMNGNNNANKKK
jgi:YidC/Oxa1 family membrane protein insertase